MIKPHGGRLVDRVRDPDSGDTRRTSPDEVIDLDSSGLQDLVNIANGRFSPLAGFMTQNDFLKVVTDMSLEDGTTWPLPVVLDVGGKMAASLAPGTKAGLRAPEGEIVGAIDVAEVYTYNHQRTAKELYGTDDESHPGVETLFEKDDFLVGGDVNLFEAKRLHESDLFPAETRVLFEHKNWDTVAGFQTRNAPHRAHEYIQKSALELVDGLLIQPKLGDKKDSDYTDDAIIDSYHRLVEHYYPADNIAMSSFPSEMRYGGPREAVFDALVRKNQGCTHFIVGRDHAGVGDHYDEMAAQRIFEEIPEIGIEPLFYDYAFYCHVCDGMASAKTCPHDDGNRAYPSGSHIRDIVLAGEQPSEKLMRPEVSTFILECDEPFVANDMSGDR